MIASTHKLAQIALYWQRSIGLALFFFAALASPQTLSAQVNEADAGDKRPANWKQLNVPEPPGGERAAAGQARTMLRTGQIDNQDLFDGYWSWYIAQLSNYAKKDDLSAIRVDVKRQLLGRSGAPQRRLVLIVLKVAGQIVNDEQFAPIVRYNALLMLGDLNRTEPNAQGQNAVALPEALPYLVKFLDPKLPADGSVNDALRVAAMIGIQNHIERGGIPNPDARKQVVSLLQQIAQDQPAEGQRPSEINEWLQKRAQEALDKLGSDAAVAERRAAPVAAGR